MLIAIAPKTLVSTICPIFPTAIATTPITRRFGERKNTLPPYSPMRLGVNTAHVNPQKTDSIARHKLIFSTRAINLFHFNASMPQLTSISKQTIPSIKVISALGICFKRSLNACKFSLEDSFLYTNQNAIITIAVLRKYDNIFL